MAMFLPSLHLLPLGTSLKVEEVASVQVGKMGPGRDVTLAGFLTMALKLHLIGSFLACSLQVILPKGLVSPQALPEAGHPLASTLLLFITVF